MPGLSCSDLPVVLADGGKSLAETELCGSGHSGDAAVEVSLDLASDLEAFILESYQIDTETGCKGGETEGRLLIEVGTVRSDIHILRDIEEEVFGAGDALTGVESEIVTNETVRLQGSNLVLGES